jgi:hypothetical protein
MRLEILNSGHRRVQKFFLGIIRRLVGQVPGPIATMSYRSEFWGKEFSGCLQEAMRGPSPWAVWEREIFSAFVSKLNQCRY